MTPPLFRWRWSAWCAALLFAALASPVAAQQSADTLAGRVLASDSTPIPHARLRATAADGREQTATAGGDGRYELVLSGGPGSYAVQVSAFGYLPFTAVAQVEPGAGRTLRDFRLNARPLVLEGINVVAAAPTQPERRTPGERAERWDAFLSHGHPVHPGSFADVGSMVSGVVRSGDGLSVDGQSPGQNGATVDGATFGGASLPSEGVRSVAVFGTTYDVSRGRYSGGQVAASTISGTNLWGGAVTAGVDDPRLRYGAPPAGLASRDGRLLRLNGGGGGALVRDRLFVFGALDLDRSTEPAPALDRLDVAALRQLPLSPDSAARLAQIGGRLGLLPAGAGPLPDAASQSVRGLARVDWAAGRFGSLTTRLDWRGFHLSGLGASPFRLSGGTGEVRSRDAGVLVQHAGVWGRAANSVRLYRSAGRTRPDRTVALPAGVVRVSSILEDGTSGLSLLSFGGMHALPGDERSLWEIGDDLRVAAGGHQVRAGFLLQEERAEQEAAATAGTFTFNSLDALERGRAASFTRVLSDLSGEAARRYGALYLGDSWRPASGLGLIYGLRIEGTRYAARPALPGGLESIVEPGTARVPSDLVLTPRIGFSYAPGTNPRWGVAGGVGGFAGVPGLAQLSPHWDRGGSAALVLSCVGPAAPAAEWSRYAADPSTVPVTCAGGAPVFADAAPDVTVFDREFRGPRTWRASLDVGRSLTSNWGVTAAGLLVRGTGLPTATDRNLRPTSGFHLADEGGRPVYAEPGEIDPGTGGIAPGAGRRLPSFGAVEEIGSRGESWTAQGTVATGGSLGHYGIRLDLRYTYTHSRILAGGVPAPGGAVATTAGDPARLEWMDAPFTPRHHLFASVSGRPARRVRVTAIGMLSSGLPFTPLVGGDVNGDGLANDRAFLFPPDDVADPALEAGLRRLMEAGPAEVRRCLRAGMGRIAAPGSCRTPWSPSLDLRVEITPWGSLNARRFVLGIDARNVTAGLDHLLYGPERLRGWGQAAAPDDRLLEVRGFDPARAAFLYDVNPRFGRAFGGGEQRSPFRLIVEGRITVGADPRYQPLMQAIALGSGNNRQSVRAELAGRLHNVPAAVLQLHATDTTALALSVAQRQFLRAAADSLAPHLGAVVDSLATAFTAHATAPPVRASRLQAATLHAVRLQEAALQRTRGILTTDQWNRLPAWLTRPVQPGELQRSPRFQMEVP
jgi:hypothetical protein